MSESSFDNNGQPHLENTYRVARCLTHQCARPTSTVRIGTLGGLSEPALLERIMNNGATFLAPTGNKNWIVRLTDLRRLQKQNKITNGLTSRRSRHEVVSVLP